MPMYDYVCDACDSLTENVLRAVADKDSRQCPECGGPSHTVILSTPAIVGAVWDKKIHVGGLDRTFETNAEFRQWEKENPDTHVVSRNSSDWDRIRYNARNNAAETVKKWGFGSTHAFSEAAKTANANGVAWNQ